TCAGVKSKEPAIVPLVPGGVACGDLVIVRSYTRSRRAPVVTPTPSFAAVAADAIFSKEPLSVSFFPLSVADALPIPASNDAGVWPLSPRNPNGGAGARRAL